MSDLELRQSLDVADRYDLVATYLLSLRSDESKRTMLSSLGSVTRLLAAHSGQEAADPHRVAWHLMTFREAQALAAAMGNAGWSSATVNRHLSAVRGVVRTGKYLGAIPPAVADHICDVALRNLRPGHSGVDPAGRLVTKQELDAMFETATASDDNLTRRDVAMLAVLARSGMRRSELVGLRVEDWRPVVGELLILRGKGSVKRKTWLSGWTVQALEAWLTARGTMDGPLFTRVFRGGRVDPKLRHLSTQTVYDRLHLMAKAAGVDPFAPHDLRRRVATLLLDEGHDIATVAKVLGHRQITTTAIYDRRDERTAAAAAEANLVFLDGLAV